MKTLTLVYFLLLLLVATACGKDKSSEATTSTPAPLAAWAQGDQNDFMNGCIATAHASKPSYTFTQVETYCQCTLTAAMKLWSAADFSASNTADAQTLYDNGTVAGCKTQAGVQ